MRIGGGTLPRLLCGVESSVCGVMSEWIELVAATGEMRQQRMETNRFSVSARKGPGRPGLTSPVISAMILTTATVIVTATV